MFTSGPARIGLFAVALTLVTTIPPQIMTVQAAGTPPADPSRLASLAAVAVNQPVAFVENRGQADGRIRYYAQGRSFGFFMTPDEIMMSLLRSPAGTDGVTLALQFLGASGATPIGIDRTSGTVNYLHGSDPAKWQTGLARYSSVVYRGLWPGIDLQVREAQGTLKYEFRVAPGADPAAIRLAYRGADGLSVDGRGALAIATRIGTLRDAAPASYQMNGQRQVAVASRFALAPGESNRFAFELGPYDKSHELIIDPGVQYTTFIGGDSHEMPGGVVADASGNAYVVGFTQSPNFPTTAGAFDRTGAVSTVSDVFVTKFNAAGSGLVYSTFIGGSDFEFARRIAVDGAGNAYITGQTKSSNYPTTANAFDRTFNVLNCPRCGIDQYDAFVTKLNATGSALVYSTFLGGTDIDDAHGIAVDASGSAYVIGETSSHDFPVTAGAFERTFTGDGTEVFVTKLNPAGSALAYSSFLGGTAVDNGERVAVDAAGQAFVMGFTSSTDFPTTAAAFSRTNHGSFDVFVTKFNATGSALVYSTLLGGSGADGGGGLAIDASGNAYISGGAGSVDFPTTAGTFDPISDGSDAFIAKLNPAGSALVYSTVLGGSGNDGANGVAIDASGNAWLTGITNSPDFPVTASAYEPNYHGTPDAWVSEVNATGSTLLYSTYLGGASNSEGGDDIALDRTTGIYVVGHTYSLDFPATVGAFDTVWNGDATIFWGDGFLTKFRTDLTTQTSTPVAPAATPVAPSLLAPANGEAPAQPITFDWSDVPSAATYSIQIAKDSGFGTVVRSADVPHSVYATTGLDPVPHFWRARGVNVNGVAGAWSAVRTFTPQPPPPPAGLSTMSTSPASVQGGQQAVGTVVLTVGASEGGALISLSSSNPAVASVPATTFVPANGFTGDFVITTSAVTAPTSVTITASYNGATRTTTLGVTVPGAAPLLQRFVLSPDSVTGTAGSQGVVFLADVAPAGGEVVTLSSNNTSVASVPASVTVAAGASNAVFNISTSGTAGTATISATAGVTLTAPLTVTTAAPPPPPPQTATLSLTASGRSGVHVTTTPTGIDAVTGTTKSGSFNVGTSIRISVGSGRSANFSGACTASKASSCTFTLNAGASVTVAVQ